MIVLSVKKKNNKIVQFYFNSITEAYNYYVRHYATFAERFYYFRVAHTSLDKVVDERIMKSLFVNCFKNGTIGKVRY